LIHFPRNFFMDCSSRFFFLRGPTALVWLGRTKRTDFLIDSDQLLAEFLQAVKLGDFLLRFTESRRTGKSLGNGFAVDPAGEPNLGIVPGIIGLRTVTVGFAAATGDGGDGARAQITQREELLKELGAIRFQSSDGMGHERPPHSERIDTLRRMA
jgi:hypothetical protein